MRRIYCVLPELNYKKKKVKSLDTSQRATQDLVMFENKLETLMRNLNETLKPLQFALTLMDVNRLMIRAGYFVCPLESCMCVLLCGGRMTCLILCVCLCVRFLFLY